MELCDIFGDDKSQDHGHQRHKRAVYEHHRAILPKDPHKLRPAGHAGPDQKHGQPKLPECFQGGGRHSHGDAPNVPEVPQRQGHEQRAARIAQRERGPAGKGERKFPQQDPQENCQ